MFSKFKQYVEEAKKLPQTKTMENVKTCAQDPLKLRKIHFLSLAASVLEPFLRGYQSSKPCSSFFYQHVLDILYILMSRFLNRVILGAATTPKKILNVDAMDDNDWCPVKNVDCSTVASKLLRKSC